ncbi:MAG: prepilin-type N-terminal cleavage/methylation domain-containing protein, partial [Oscillospiraceae bacterium]
MKNNKGFTLVEVMVALSLMAIIVASFAPLMVSSLKSVKISGDMVDEAYSAKTEMENLIALGVQNEGQQIAVDYIHQGTTEKAENVIVEGKYLSSTGTKYVKLDTFIAKDIGTISISPSSISENCSAFDTVVSITSDIIEFSDVANFRLTNKKGEVVPISDTEFKIDGNNPHNATMKIRNSSNISISQGPYKVCYNSGYAILYITPAPVIAVGNDGAYYARTDGGKWIKGKRITATSPEGKMGDRTLNDITWTGSQYICGGAYGSYFYTDDEGWQNRSSADQRDTVYDVLYSQILQKPVYATGFKERGSVFDVKRPYTQMMSDPLEFNFAKNSGIFEIPRVGKCLTDGFIGDKEIALWAYDTYPFLNSYDGSYVSVNNINQIGGGIGSKILAMDSNRKKGPQSEFMLLTYNRIYSLKPTGNGESGGGEWKDITISASQDNQVVE